MPVAPAKVLHLVEFPGSRYEQWIDGQAVATSRYTHEILGVVGRAEPYFWLKTARSAPGESRAWRLASRIQRTAPRMRVDATLMVDRIRATRNLFEDASLVHAHFAPLAVNCLTAIERSGLPLVVSLYGYDASSDWTRREPWRSRYQRLWARAQAVVVEGPNMARRVKELGCDGAKIHVVRLPFANVEVPFARPEGRRPYATVAAGRLVEKKGFAHALRAFGAAFAGGRERMLVIGDGPERPSLERLRDELGLIDRVDIRPPVSLPELAAALQEGEVVVFPSVTARNGDGEGGAPLLLTLAQAVGRPVVITDHDDLPWAAAPGTPVVPAGDVDALAAALRELHDGAVAGDLDQSLAQARSWVATEYDALTLAEKRADVYDLAVSSESER